MSWQAKNLNADKHCFFGSDGGVSKGKYASLNTNLSSSDAREKVLENYEIIAGKFFLKRENMATIRQSVSNTAIFIDEPSWFQNTADGMVTTKKDILLCIKTADCAPVLLTDYANGVIGTAHAGWRGAYKGIVENVIKLMVQHGAKIENIAAAIGPCLQKASFEVKEDMRQFFIKENGKNIRYFKPFEDGFLFDLESYLEDKLKNLGIINVCKSQIDTYPLNSNYFSYRRSKHLNLLEQQFDYPTQQSVIML